MKGQTEPGMTTNPEKKRIGTMPRAGSCQKKALSFMLRHAFQVPVPVAVVMIGS